MWFVIIEFVLAAVSTFLTVMCCDLVHHLRDIWIPVLLSFAYVIAAIAATFAFIFGSALFVKEEETDFIEKPHKFSKWMVNQTIFFLSFWGRAKIKTEGFENLPNKDERFIVYANHISKFDSVVTNVSMPDRDLVWIAKRSLFKMPLIHKHLKNAAFMPIDREDLKQSLGVIKQAVRLLDEGITSVGVYPEGTRNNTDAPLLDIHPGSFKIALKAKKPIVIIYTKNAEKIHKRFLYASTHVYVKVCEVLKYEDYKDMSSIELADHVKNKLLEAYEELKDYKA